MKIALLLLIASSCFATDIPTAISQRSRQVTVKSGTTMCAANGIKISGKIYSFSYQVPVDKTFYGAQVCQYGTTQFYAYQISSASASVSDGAADAPGMGVLFGDNANLSDVAMISHCKVFNGNFQGGHYPVFIPRTDGNFYVCVTGMVE